MIRTLNEALLSWLFLLLAGASTVSLIFIASSLSSYKEHRYGLIREICSKDKSGNINSKKAAQALGLSPDSDYLKRGAVEQLGYKVAVQDFCRAYLN